jgi:hypothetical protein
MVGFPSEIVMYCDPSPPNGRAAPWYLLKLPKRCWLMIFFGYYPIPVDPYLPSQYLDHLGSIGNIRNEYYWGYHYKLGILVFNDSMKLSFEVKHEISNKPVLSPCQCRVVRARWYRKNCLDRCSTRHGRGDVLQCSYKNWCNMTLSKAILRHFPWITWIGRYIIRDIRITLW